MKIDNTINTFKTINEVEEFRKMVNEMCDKRHKFIVLCEEANDLSNKSFSFIKESFESLSPILFKTSEGKKLMNKYTKMIKENKNLSSLHTINENIRKASNNTDIDFFVNNLMSIEWGVNSLTLKEDTKKLGRVLSEAYLLIGENAKEFIPKENISLSKAVNFIAECQKGTKNISEFSDAVKIIKEHIKSNTTKNNIFENVDLNTLSDTLIQEFNLKYSDKLNANEIAVLKEISCSNDRESIFNKYKNACTSKIIEAKKNFEIKGDKSSSDRLNVVLEQISNKTFTLETIGTDICSLIELSNIFE
jgi:hypothetical protein